MNFLVGNTVAGHSHHHASQATIGHSGEDFFHQSRKTGFVHLEKLGLFPPEKLASIASRWGSMLERLPAPAFLPRFLHFLKFLAQKVSSVGASSCPLFATTLALSGPFSLQWEFLSFMCLNAGQKAKWLLRGRRWKTLWSCCWDKKLARVGKNYQTGLIVCWLQPAETGRK